MKKKLISGLAAVALLAVVAPAGAHGGPPRGHGYGHWKHGHHHVHKPHSVRERYVVREVVRPMPVYPAAYPAYPVAAPGIHVVFPNLFVPFH